MKKKYLEAGSIVNTHGVVGEMKIMPWCDSPEFLRGFRRIFIDGVERRVNSSRVHKNMLLVKLEGVNDMDAAIAMKNKTVYIDRNDAELPPGKYFIQDMIGLPVFDERQGIEIGKLTEILQKPANDVYVVTGKTEYLIPAVKDFIISADPDEGIIRVRTIEGMSDAE